MSKSVNSVTLLGNLTRDPELKEISNGLKVCNFSLALGRSYKDKAGQWQEATDFVNCVAWSTLAERIEQYLSKGSRVLVQGRLQSSSWEKDGQKHSKLEVLANDVTFLDNQKSATKTEEQKASEKVDEEAIDLNSIPF